MFTFQQNSYDFNFGTPTASQAGLQILDDLISDEAYKNGTLISFAAGGHGGAFGETKSLEQSLGRQVESKNGCSGKKIMHREVEKKRRQDMSSLCSSLASLLPLKQIKGKRSIGDQIEEAVEHIKQTEKNIERLRIRRDKLKKSLGLSNPKFSSSCGDNDCIKVNLSHNGLEILISSSDLGFSRLLPVLAQRDLDVVSCVSTRMEGKMFHIIKIEAADMTSLDASELQDRLRGAIK